MTLPRNRSPRWKFSQAPPSMSLVGGSFLFPIFSSGDFKLVRDCGRLAFPDNRQERLPVH